MFQPFGLVVNLVPRIVEEIMEETLQQTVVAKNLQSTVRFEVERLLGVPVGEVNVFVQGVHEDRATS